MRERNYAFELLRIACGSIERRASGWGTFGIRHPLMRHITVPVAILAALSLTSAAADLGPDKTSRAAIQSKARYCTFCHGRSGEGYHGYYAIPRLAGQTTEYFENQLAAFTERRRDSNMALVMAKVHGVKPDLRSPLAAHFAGLTPEAFGSGPKRLADTGKKIYDEGVPDANIPACAACHGPEAQGNGANPRLSGQLYRYVVRQLTGWSKQRGQHPSAKAASVAEDASATMKPIAASLDKAQIEAVAAYLSNLK